MNTFAFKNTDYENALAGLDAEFPGIEKNLLDKLFIEREIDTYREKQNNKLCGGSILFFLLHKRRMNIKEFLAAEKFRLLVKIRCRECRFRDVFVFFPPPPTINDRERIEIEKIDMLISYIENEGLLNA
jgi:hypothetical protein